MKDIGLGILDPYTVVIVLITLVLAQVLFGYQIPLDSTNAMQLFVSLVLFTGYIYATRSLIRLPIAAIRAVIVMNNSLRVGYDFAADQNGFNRIKRTLKNLWDLISNFHLILGYWFLFILDFSSDDDRPRGDSNLFIRYVLAILDRLSLILITAFAVIPTYKGYFQSFAIAGLFFLMI